MTKATSPSPPPSISVGSDWVAGPPQSLRWLLALAKVFELVPHSEQEKESEETGTPEWSSL